MAREYNAPSDKRTNSYAGANTNANASMPPLRPRRGAAMGQPVEKPKDAKKTLGRLMNYFARSGKLLYGLIGAVIAVTLASLAAPSLQGKLIDRIKDRNWNHFEVMLLLLLAIYAFQGICTLLRSLLSANLSQTIVQNMRYDLFDKIDHLSIAYLDQHSSGDIMSRMTNDVGNISNTISQSLASLISGVLTIVGTIAIMMIYCWQLTCITLITVVMTALYTKFMSKKLRKLYRRRSQALGMVNGHADEMITGYRPIVAYNKQEQVKKEFQELSDTLTKESIKADVLSSFMGPVMDCLSNLSFVIVAGFGGYFALKGMITIGVISAFIVYAKQFSRPVNEIAQLYGSLQTAIAGAERVFELMDEPDENKDGELKLEPLVGNISFKNVDFSYLPGKQVLHNFNLEVKAGQKIALVGATGSGKTTVVNLLMRFYQPDNGEILIDGENILDMDRDWLRRNTAIVLQDTVLFSDSIENNIKYSRPDAEDEEMLKAAEMSNAATFIERLPEKYQTYLKQAGGGLSHGQRQLLNIARAILAQPKILILDEATSSVDTRTELHIQDAMVKLMKNRTSLIIAHRLSTIQDADVIVVMDKGTVVETGNHEELLAKKGQYYELYMSQFAGNQT